MFFERMPGMTLTSCLVRSGAHDLLFIKNCKKSFDLTRVHAVIIKENSQQRHNKQTNSLYGIKRGYKS